MNENCPGGLTPDSLRWCDGKVQMPGIRNRVYFIPKRDIVLFPKLPEIDENADAKKLSVYEGSFELAVNTKWKYIDVMTDKSPVNSEPQGDPPSVTALNTGTFFHSGTEEEATSFARLANNSDFVYLFQIRKGKYRVIGNEMYQTSTKVSQNLGDNATSEIGTSIVVTVTDECPPPFYTGEIVTEDEDDVTIRKTSQDICNDLENMGDFTPGDVTQVMSGKYNIGFLADNTPVWLLRKK